jgi:glycosyltransferase involved in cell wall biosynthesis
VLDSIAAAFLGPWLLRRPGTPLVGSLHQPPGGIDHDGTRRAVQVVLDRLAYRTAELLLVASESLADELVAAGVGSDRLRVVPPGRDPAVSGRAPGGDLRRGARCAFLCVGNWIRRKDILALLEALAGLPSEVGTLHLVGDDRADPSYAREVRERLRRPDLTGRVVVHGVVAREAVAGLYQAADVFVLASRKEPYGTVWGEAMAAGLPVVGWRAGNLPYLADDGREALLLEPGDLRGLRNALYTLALDKGLRKRLGDAGRRRALTRPTWEEAAKLFFDALGEVARKDRRP